MNEEFKRNLSLIAKSIASKLLVASNPTSDHEQKQDSLNQLLSQISKAPEHHAFVEMEKPMKDLSKRQTFDEDFKQVMLGMYYW